VPTLYSFAKDRMGQSDTFNTGWGVSS